MQLAKHHLRWLRTHARDVREGQQSLVWSESMVRLLYWHVTHQAAVKSTNTGRSSATQGAHLGRIPGLPGRLLSTARGSLYCRDAACATSSFWAKCASRTDPAATKAGRRSARQATSWTAVGVAPSGRGEARRPLKHGGRGASPGRYSCADRPTAGLRFGEPRRSSMEH
jgi:hypothetical protein